MTEEISNSQGTAQIELTIRLELSADEIWPDGAPDTWDAHTVLAEIQKSRDAENFIDDWDALIFGADVSVWSGSKTANGHLR